jgi:transcriptional regulator with XRE-family HTH domain
MSFFPVPGCRILSMKMRRTQDNTLAHRVARVVKALREESGKSQEDVYNEINIHIARIESSAPNPTLHTLETLAKYFNIKLSDFFQRVENIRP